MPRTRQHFTTQQKAKILRKHLIDKVPISDLCREHGMHPTVFYRWQRALFENASLALEPHGRLKRRQKAEEERAAQLERKLSAKNEVLAELMEEHVALKKKLGEI